MIAQRCDAHFFSCIPSFHMALYVTALYSCRVAELSLMNRTSILGMNLNCMYAGPATEPGLPGPEARWLTTSPMSISTYELRVEDGW